MNKIKVIVVDDHRVFRKGIKFLINQIENLDVVAEASNGVEFLEIINYQKPDLIFMDIKMPEMDGIEATKKALELYPDLKIIALTMFDDFEYVQLMMSAGAKSFLTKTVEKEELEKAVASVLDDKFYYREYGFYER